MIDASGSVDPYVQSLVRARLQPAVIKIGLLNFRSNFPQGQIFAVEGNDDKIVYSHWIGRVIPTLAYEFFVCGGKKEARQLRNSLHEDRGPALEKILFLIDRDFDDMRDFRTSDGVFMLDRYSIENYVVDKDVLDLSIKAAYPGTSQPETRSSICHMFSVDYASFLAVTRELNRRLFIARTLRLQIEEKLPDSLTRIATVQIGKVEPTAVPAAELLPLPNSPSPEVEEELSQKFAALKPAERYRGKFALKFLHAWLDSLASEYRNASSNLFSVGGRAEGKIRHEELSLGSLAARCSIPTGLEAFLLSQITL